MDRYEVGDEVRDKFKAPKPGDKAVTGRIENLNQTMIHVRMDDGLLRSMPRATFAALFERLHE